MDKEFSQDTRKMIQEIHDNNRAITLEYDIVWMCIIWVPWRFSREINQGEYEAMESGMTPGEAIYRAYQKYKGE